MANPVTFPVTETCFKNPVKQASGATYSFGVARFVVNGTGWFITLERPFLPIVAVKESNGGFSPTTVAIMKAQQDIIGYFCEECRKASQNAVDGVTAAPNAQYVTGYFGGTLAALANVNNQNDMDRFKGNYSIIWNFWNMLDAAITQNDLWVKLYSTLPLAVAEIADKRLYIPPGKYSFPNTNALDTAIAALVAADATVIGLQGVQLNES